MRIEKDQKSATEICQAQKAILIESFPSMDILRQNAEAQKKIEHCAYSKIVIRGGKSCQAGVTPDRRQEIRPCVLNAGEEVGRRRREARKEKKKQRRQARREWTLG